MARKRPSLFLIDGHAQIFRSYHAPFAAALTSPTTGEPTKAVHVFTQMVLNLLKNRRPDYLAMVMDVSDRTVFRCEIDPEYKAHRDPAPEDLGPQIERIVEILQAMQVPIYRQEGFEADDLIATIVTQLADRDLDIYMVSKDKDLDQLLTDRVHMYDPGKDEVLTADTLFERKGFRPEQTIDVQTLAGDSVDNVRGVEGIGVKTAAKLVNEFGSAAAVLANADKLTPKRKQRVLEFADLIDTTRQIVTLRRDVPMAFDLAAAAVECIAPGEAADVFRELGMNRLLELVGGDQGEDSRDVAQPPAVASGPESVTYTLINTDAAFAEFAQKLESQPRFAFDTETTAIDPMRAKLVGLSFSWQAGEAVYIPVRGPFGAGLSETMVLDRLRPIFLDERNQKIAQNMKYDLLVLKNAGLKIRGRVFDTMIASFVLDSSRRSHGLDALALDLFGHQMIPLTDLIGKGKDQITIDEVELDHVCEYAAEDADFTWRLAEHFRPQIEGGPFEQLFDETEMPLMHVLAEMEYKGVQLDRSVLATMSNEIGDRMVTLTHAIHEAAGRPFNVDSPKQLAEVLYDELKLPVLKRTRTSRSTDADTLTQLAERGEHELPSLVLEYRELAKLKGTYIDALPKLVHPTTGRIHCSYSQTSAVTGRLASSDPNLQNIPIRTATGREIRRAFVAGEPDRILITADYSQVELRILAHLSDDAGLIRAFRDDQDIHHTVAAEVFGLMPELVTPEHRSRAKAVNFGIIYGQSAFGLSRQTGMSVADAKAFIDAYFKRFPGIRTFIDATVADAKENGYVSTMLGRRRLIPELRSRNKQQSNLGERVAVNTVVQGSAADLIKRAMIRIQDRIEKEGRNACMLIQVHDELVFETKRESCDADADMIRAEMSSAFELAVPLKVDVGTGDNWLDSK